MRPPMRGGGGGGFMGRGGRDGGGGRFGGGGGRFGGGGGRFGGGGGRFGGGGGRFGRSEEGPPEQVVEVATFVHACEGDAVTKLSHEKVPYFNAPIYLENMTQIGKVDEIFGPINESLFSIKMMEGIVATSYSPGDKFFIDPGKLLPLSRFLPQPKGQSTGGRGRGRGDGRGGSRGRGGSFRGRGAPRGGRFPSRGGRGGSFGGGFRGRGRG